MFKEQGGFWLYFAGLIVMFLLLFYVAEVLTGKASLGLGKSATPVPTRIVTTNAPGKSSTPVNYTDLKTFDITKNYYAEITTNLGVLKVDLYERNAPNTVANFINLTNTAYYNGTKFYKLTPGVAVQGGSKDNSVNGNPGYTIPDEINWDSLDYNEDLRLQLRAAGYTSARRIASVDLDKYELVTVNPKPNSAGSQFMILLSGKENSTVLSMRGKVTVFGKIIDDTSVIEKIAVLNVNTNGAFSKPQNDLTISEIKIYIKQ